MTDSDFQLLLAIFPTVLFFISLIPRVIVHYPQRKSSVRETINSIDINFIFNLIIDSFALSVANGLILMFQFKELTAGFVFMFVCMALCIFGFSSLHVKSVQGATFILFILGILFITETVFFLQPTLSLLWQIPISFLVIFMLLIVILIMQKIMQNIKKIIQKTRHAPLDDAKPLSP